ncbi:MAG: CAP domain-containing protein [Methylacidiphilales bacterium]|nr:CAP domain-containing protein [Candidatus Methylacidiphilales bacterium]
MSLRFLLLFGLVALLGLRSVPAQQTAATHPVTDYGHNLEQETFYLINAYRKADNLPPLQWDFNIAKVARDHSRDMAVGEVDFGHDGFHERVARLGALLPGLKAAGENIFESDDPDQLAQSAVAVWLKSPHHLKNICGDFNYSGLGVWQDKEGTVYFTQIFLKLQPADRTTQAAPPTPGLTTPLGLLATPYTR